MTKDNEQTVFFACCDMCGHKTRVKKVETHIGFLFICGNFLCLKEFSQGGAYDIF